MTKVTGVHARDSVLTWRLQDPVAIQAWTLYCTWNILSLPIATIMLLEGNKKHKKMDHKPLVSSATDFPCGSEREKHETK